MSVCVCVCVGGGGWLVALCCVVLSCGVCCVVGVCVLASASVWFCVCL